MKEPKTDGQGHLAASGPPYNVTLSCWNGLLAQETGPEFWMKWDKELINLFVVGLNRKTGSKYVFLSHPDEDNRHHEAVDAIYDDPAFGKVAIEHTLLQMFEGQKSDDVPFNRVFGQLWSDKTLRVPGRRIVLFVHPFSILRGVDWGLASQKVSEWFRSVRLTLPDGKSEHTIQFLRHHLRVTVDSMDATKWFLPPHVWVVRTLPSDPCRDLVWTILQTKLAKLAGTPADRRILLVECATPWSYQEIIDAMESVGPKFPDLAAIEAIWVADTTPWKTESCVGCQTIWPGKVRELFLVSCDQDGSVADVE